MTKLNENSQVLLFFTEDFEVENRKPTDDSLFPQ